MAIYIYSRTISARRKLCYLAAVVVGLPAVYFGASHFRELPGARSFAAPVALALQSAPSSREAGISQPTSKVIAGVTVPTSAGLTADEAQAAYEKADFASTCAFAASVREDAYAALPNLAPEDASKMQQQIAQMADECRGIAMNPAAIDALMKQAADAGQLDAKHYFLMKQAHRLEILHVQQMRAGVEQVITPEKVALVNEIKELAYTSGSRRALLDLAGIYGSGFIAPFDLVTAGALQAVAVNEEQGKLAFHEEIFPEGATEEQREAIRVKAQEIFERCCQRSHESS